MPYATAPRRRLRARGFTLIELMVVVALLAIVSSLAAPGLRAFASGQRVKTVAFDLTTDLLFARSEALKRNATVTVTPVGSDWSAGWTVTSGGIELASREAAGEALQFTSAPGSITFNVFGRVSSPADAVRITLRSSTSASTNATRCIALDLSGRAGSKVGACA